MDRPAVTALLLTLALLLSSSLLAVFVPGVLLLGRRKGKRLTPSGATTTTTTTAAAAADTAAPKAPGGNGNSNGQSQTAPPAGTPTGPASWSLTRSPPAPPGQAYTAPLVPSVHLPSGALPPKVLHKAVTYTRAADAEAMFGRGNIYTTRRRHGVIRAAGAFARFDACAQAGTPVAYNPKVPSTERAFTDTVDKARALLPGVSNGHASLGAATVATVQLPCRWPSLLAASAASAGDKCTNAELEQIAAELRARLSLPDATTLVAYLGGLAACKFSGQGTRYCRPNRFPVGACNVWINGPGENGLVHELVHNLGGNHSNSAANDEYGDPTCLMGYGRNVLGAAHAYGNGWLDDAEFVELDAITGAAGGRAGEVALRNDPRHGVVVYVAVAVFNGTRYAGLLPLPCLVLSYRTYFDKNVNKTLSHVLVHDLNRDQLPPPDAEALESPKTRLLARLDAPGQAHVYAASGGAAARVPLAYEQSVEIARLVASGFRPVPAALARALGLPGVARPPLRDLSVTLLRRDATAATVRLAPVGA
jgi:Gametolysin peptidase M11